MGFLKMVVMNGLIMLRLMVLVFMNDESRVLKDERVGVIIIMIFGKLKIRNNVYLIYW